MQTLCRPWLLLPILCASPSVVADEPYHLHHFDRIQLTDVYYSEGASIGDLDRDGDVDVVHGPYYFLGPDFKDKREIWPARAQPRQAYADNFFSWVYDFNDDGWSDVFTVGFPGTPAHVYENPTASGFDQPWPKHEVFDWVSNESPHFANLVGDDRPELVCTRDGHFGYATIDSEHAFGRWKFHAISEQIAPKRFGHGLGIGDIDGDARLDIITKDGWFRQPEDLSGESLWQFHASPFARAGGAEMHAYDVDGDGDNDVITSLAAHEYGLAWHEQIREGDAIRFRQHLIMGSKPEENRYGLVFTELHSIKLADMDGDGLRDIVTGKTYWSHHTQSPMWDAGAVVYWFKLVRTEDGVDWIPYKADDESGIGRQVVVGDVNGDELPDIVVGGMKGSHVLVHRVESVDKEVWSRAQPQLRKELASGLSPESAAKQMTAPEGFRVQLAAGEPMVHQPIAFSIDHRGRAWVAEAYTYPIRAPEGQGKDKIVILEDEDGDGTFDSRKVFIEGLNLVSGMELGFGGVWVGAAPYLMFIPDKDGDDQPDGPPQILLDGFGYHDTHETLNAFIWGPDGWLYGCHGVFTHSKVGRPGTPDDERVPMNAAIWRYHPTKHEFEVFGWGTSNPWGVDFNEKGQAFATACVIPHMYHIIQGARYQRQAGEHFNPYVFDDIKTIADHAHYAGNIRDHAWWGHEPDIPSSTSEAGGGHAHCGAMIYLGDNWPERYRDQIFFNNIHGNRVNNDFMDRKGSGYVGRHNNDFLFANDRWFRGINLKYGPDGGVYLIDWYDKNACHRRNPEVWDRTNGRIYKITYGKPERPATPEVDLATRPTKKLVELLKDPNEWYVRTSRRILQERGGTAEMHDAIRAVVNDAATEELQLRAIWTLHATGGLDADTTVAMLESPHEYVRAWAIQLQLENGDVSDEFLSRMTRLAADDSSPAVRLYLAAALQRLPPAQRWPIAQALLGHAEDTEDHNLPLMYWYGIEPLVEADPARAMQLARGSKIELVRRYLIRRAAVDNRLLNDVVAGIADAEGVEAKGLILDEMLNAFEGRVDIPLPSAWEAAYVALGKSDDASIRDRADKIAVAFGDKRILPRLRATLVDRDASDPQRLAALRILVRGRDREAATALQAVISEKALRAESLRALAALDDPDTPKAILDSYSQFDDKDRADAVATLVSRPSYALALLDRMEKEQVPRTDLHAFHIRQLLQFEDDTLNQRIEDVWGEIRAPSANRRELIAKYKDMVSARLASGNVSNGRRLFSKTCASCHTLFGEGGKVGPDITGSNRANLDYILENVLDPSAVLGKDYRMTVLITADGRVVSGLAQKETDSALTLRTINDTVVIPKADIDERQLSSQSLMPERLLDTLKPDEVTDLVAYLGSPIQVALSGPKAPIDPETNGVRGAVEGETIKITKKTGGNAQSQGMGAFRKDRWSNNSHLWWNGAKPGARLELELPVEQSGRFRIEVVMTRARDYGIVQLTLDGKPLGGTIDLYNRPDVITTGVLEFDDLVLEAGAHNFGVEIVGANPKADPSYMFGLDYVRIVPSEQPATASSD